jgi:hypothetical protein
MLGGGWRLFPPSRRYDWISIYTNADGSKGMVILRGSKNNTSDRVMDHAILNGCEMSTNRWEIVQKMFRLARKTFPHINKWAAVGHSSGGTVAIMLNRRFGIKSFAYNPGVTPPGLKKRLERDFRRETNQHHAREKSTVYVVPTDKLSNLALKQPFDEKVVVAPRAGVKNPHSMENFA